jgi:hypothetical protein
MKSLLEQLEASQATVVAVLGLAKNCGKTTALNHLAKAYEKLGCRLGLTSIGRDGEPVDLITQRPKPSICVNPGDLFLTAEESYRACKAAACILKHTGIRGALGELLLAEASGAGEIELSGPTTSAEARTAVQLLKEAGAKRILIDGAFDRRATGSPAVSDAVVLSGGAVLGPTVESVAMKIAHQARLLMLPEISGSLAPMIRSKFRESDYSAALIDRAGDCIELSGSALTQLEELRRALGENSSCLWVGGALTDEIIKQLLECAFLPEIVVADATRIFLSPMSYARLGHAGGSIKVLTGINLTGITTNPTNPMGPSLNPALLVEAVAAALPEIPVYDVVAGLARLTGANARQPALSSKDLE